MDCITLLLSMGHGLYNAVQPMGHGIYIPVGHGLYNVFVDYIFPMTHGPYNTVVVHGSWVVQCCTTHGSWDIHSHGAWAVQRLSELSTSHDPWTIQHCCCPWVMDCTMLYNPWVMGCTMLYNPWVMGYTFPWGMGCTTPF